MTETFKEATREDVAESRAPSTDLRAEHLPTNEQISIDAQKLATEVVKATEQVTATEATTAAKPTVSTSRGIGSFWGI